MRIINIVAISGRDVESIDSFPVYEEQLFDDVYQEAFEFFKKKVTDFVGVNFENYDNTTGVRGSLKSVEIVYSYI